MASSTLMDQSLLGSINMDDLLNTIGETEMTLEDFLTKAGAVAPGDVEFDDGANGSRERKQLGVCGFTTDGVEADDMAVDTQWYGVGGYGVEGGFRERGKRRRAVAAEEVAVDRVTQQRQRRMIKNRESAARSRERKQAYTVELEALVLQLEEENARLVREEAERSRKRFKKLMENLIPAGEKERPLPRAHRRVHSVGW